MLIVSLSVIVMMCLHSGRFFHLKLFFEVFIRLCWDLFLSFALYYQLFSKFPVLVASLNISSDIYYFAIIVVFFFHFQKLLMNIYTITVHVLSLLNCQLLMANHISVFHLSKFTFLYISRLLPVSVSLTVSKKNHVSSDQ